MRTKCIVQGPLFAILFSISSSLLFGEGSKNITPAFVGPANGLNTYVGYLEHSAELPGFSFSSGDFLQADAPEQERVYIHIRNGETLYWGLRRIQSTFAGSADPSDENEDLTVILYRNDGTVANSWLLTDDDASPQSSAFDAQPGVIADYASVLAGPNAVVPGGYNALSYTNTTGVDQDFYVAFVQADGGSEDPDDDVNARSWYDLWDFSVYSGVEEKPGRMFSKRWNFTAGAFNGQFSTEFQLFVRVPSEIDGVPSGSYVKELHMQGMEPFSVNVYANAFGADPGQLAGDFTVLRQSQDEELALFEYDIFINNPDVDAYPTTVLPTVKITDAVFDCNGINGEAVLNFTANQTGQVAIILDLNGVSGYQPGTTDRIIESEILTLGSFALRWDGLDGLGVAIPSGTEINIRGRYTSAPLHAPFWDSESNQQGIEMRDVRPATSFDLIYWDDTDLLAPSSNPTSQLTGTNVNTHTWDDGNNTYTNTWSFGYYQVNSQIVIFEYDCDVDEDGIANDLDLDGDNDGIADELEGAYGADTDGDGIPDYLDADFDGFLDINCDGVNDNFDTDSDGIPDGLDLDSDNDGIPDVVEAGLTDADNDGRVDVIVDSNGNGIDDTYDPTCDGSDVTGYASSVVSESGVFLPNNFLGNTPGTQAELNFGTNIRVELDHLIPNGSTINLFGNASPGEEVEISILLSATFDGGGVGTIVNIDESGSSYPIAVSEDITYLEVNYDSGSGPLFLNYLSYTIAGCLSENLPDTDSDGTPNHQDLDSDNDGITDAYEVAGQADSNGHIIGFTDVDGNGRNDTQDVGALTLTDTDGDGLSNYIDLDSDNDGILDNIEAQASSYAIPSETGDANMNGLLDVYDPSNGGTLLVPVDTDADEGADYVDVDSDDDNVPDIVEGHDSDFNGIADWDSNGAPDNDITDEVDYNTDADMNGVWAIFDGSIAPLQNTDGADLADWQDADDDNDGIPTNGEDTDANTIWFDDFTQGGGIIPDYLFRGDRDRDGVEDLADLDSDNDGILDVDEDGGESIDPSGDQDMDGIPNYRDDSDLGVTDNIDEVDANSDGVWDNYDTDLDGIPDFHDLDSDQDGILDAIEANNGAVPAGFDEAAGQFILDDPDGDGLMNAIDNAPADGLLGASTLANGDADSDGLSDFLDIDADGDGITDFVESVSVAATFSGLDEDGDGLEDAFDASEGGSQIVPVNTDGADNPDYLDSDSDNDGVPDLAEGHDANSDGFGQWDDSPENGIANELTPLEDADNDGLDDVFDTIALGSEGTNAIGSNAYLQNTDGTGQVDFRDTDDDDDGTPTSLEDNGDDIWTNDFTQGQAASSVPDYLFFGDFDGDGVLDIADLDSDNDGVPDAVEQNVEPDPSADADGDNIPNFRDPDDPGLLDNTDSNGDGVYDVYDTDLDGIPDFRDADSDNDGIPDIVESNGVDGNGDGQVDDQTDSDGDGLADVFDTDSDGTPLVILDRDLDGLRDARDLDSDNDGLSDTAELAGDRSSLTVDDDGDGLGNLYDSDNMGVALVLTDFDDDLIYDHHDRDSDNDGITDTVENGGVDSDGDGRVDGFSLDVNGNGLADSVDPEAGGTALNLVMTDASDLNVDARDLDTDNDGYPDIIEGGGTDANNDGIADNLEDTNGDGIPDVVDATETVGGNDADGDGIDDFADTDLLGGQDFDLDGIPDIFDTDQTAGPDTDMDQILDIADVDQTGGTDIDGDNIDDSLDPDRDGDGIENAFDPDADGDGLDDEIRNDPYFIDDFDGDGVPNFRDLDSDGDGLVDVEEFGGLAAPHSSGRIVEFITDVDGNGWSDAQEAAPIIPLNTDVANDPSGFSNYLDLDADNDGITDNFEAQSKATYIAPTGSSTADGLDLSYPAGSLLVATNTDGADVPDYLDDDSDNDNVPDLVEGSDADRDGFADQDLDEDDDLTDEVGYNVDVDDDGILDIYDNTVAVASQAIGSNAAIQDSDLDGVWDFQDTDDDNDGIATYDGSGGDEDIDNDGDPTDDLVASALFPDYLYAIRDADGDGFFDDGSAGRDLDADSDGLENVDEDGGTGIDPSLDFDADGLLNFEDGDMDGDGTLNVNDGDADGDTNPDTFDKSDTNGDGTVDGFDTDLDGIPDFLDRDSDNDGIADVIEFGVTAIAGFSDPDTDGQIDDAAAYEDVLDGGDGLDDGLESLLVIPPDTDSDGIPDYLDLDSDNDGITDNREAQPSATYIAPVLADDDLDGILNVYDVNVGTAITPQDTEMDGTPDYLDLDTDDDGVIDEIEGFDGNSNGFHDLDTDGDNSLVGEFGSDADVDEDGILRIYDTRITGFTNVLNIDGSNQVLQDSDGDNILDYRDNNDDGDATITLGENTTDGAGGGPDGSWANDFLQGGGTIPDYLYAPDWDGDSVLDAVDADSDNDGVSNIDEINGALYTSGSVFGDNDADGLYNYLDTDDNAAFFQDENGDGVDDRVDQDRDGIPNFFDIDSDNDGIPDGLEANGGVAATGFDAAQGIFTSLTDVDGDGIVVTADPDDASAGMLTNFSGTNPNSDGGNLMDFLDIDSDNDGIPDNVEAQATASYSAPAGNDTDQDGLDDVYDEDDDGTSISVINTDNPADTDPDYLDQDSDADGVVDFREGHDANRDGFGDWDTNGNNGPDEPAFVADTDGDGLRDLFDSFTGYGLSNITGSLAALQDTDNDGILDFRDTDDDGDVLLSDTEDGGNAIWTDDFTQGGGATPDYLYAASDRDGDGFSDASDLDSDNDGIPDAIENTSGVDPFADSDDDGVFNYLDASTLAILGLTDSDADGVADEFDFDLDGIPNFFDLDSDNDGITDHEEAGGTDDGADGNQGVLDTFVDTTPADGQDDDVSLAALDPDGDGQPNFLDLDSDNDGVQDIVEAGGSDSNSPADGYGDTPGDSDGDGLLNLFESSPLVLRDQDGDGLDNYLDVDSDNDGIPDIVEAGGADIDGDGETDDLTGTDINGWSNTHDGNALASPDTDNDGLLDAFDLDSDGDGIPDVAEANAGFFPAAITDFNGRYDYVDGDGDGLVNNVDTDNSGSALAVTSTDGDGVPDFQDTDSDADGSPDYVEAFDDDEEISGISPNDALNDYLLRATNFGAAPYVNSVDTDADGIPNWLEGSPPNFLNPNNDTYYSDVDNDGLVDLFDTDAGGMQYGGVSGVPDNNGIGGPNQLDNTDAISLPVELLSFDGKQIENKILLTWVTASELNNERFDVEKSNDGKEFRKIGTVEGNGTSSEQNSYQFTDHNPLDGINYYRLLQVDYDGQTAFSETILVIAEVEQLTVDVFPNPASDHVSIRTSRAVDFLDLRLSDLSGLLIFEKRYSGQGLNEAKVDVPVLEEGIYVLSILVNGEVENHKLVIDR